VTREVVCVEPAGELVTIGNLADIPTTVTHRLMPGTTVGHLAFNYWMLPMVKRVEAAMTELRAKGMTGLVLDLRGNPGGVGAMSIPVARMLLTRPGSLGKLQFREFAQEFNVAGEPAAFTGPVVVLVDEGTASTSEIFAAGLRDLGRVQIYGGRPSAGAALPSMIERLADGAMLQYVVGDYHSSRGAVAEGDGVRPDVLVPETRADFIAGRDPVLAAAVQALSVGGAAAKVQQP
jgi:carboxyl-terminal processing protease